MRFSVHTGTFVIGRKTTKKRMRAKLLAIKIELRRIMHDPIAKTGAWVKQMLKGHLNYFAVSGNHPSLWWFFNKVKRLWLAALQRRSQTARLSWERFIQFVARLENIRKRADKVVLAAGVQIGERPRISGPSHLCGLEADFLRALPQHGLSQRRQILQSRGQRDEMIACELPHLAGEVHAAIGQQNLGFANAAGLKNDLAWRRIAGVVFETDAEIEIAERHPNPLAAPPHMDSLALERHRLSKGCAGLWRQLFFETGLEREVAGMDEELAHSRYSR
jgi:hypothetical protein